MTAYLSDWMSKRWLNIKALDKTYAHQRLRDETDDDLRTLHISRVLGVQWSVI